MHVSQEYIESVEASTLIDCLNSERGVFGYTPLHEAVYSNKYNVIKFLIHKGANSNSRARYGYTPLHLASSAGHIDCVKVLLQCGADISLTDDYGRTPKQTASIHNRCIIVRLLRSEGKSNILIEYRLYNNVFCFKQF